MMPVVNTCVNEVNHRLMVSRLSGRLGGFPAAGRLGSPASEREVSCPVTWTAAVRSFPVGPFSELPGP